MTWYRYVSIVCRAVFAGEPPAWRAKDSWASATWRDRSCRQSPATCAAFLILLVQPAVLLVGWKSCHTVDGRNPAPPDMYETLSIMG